MRARQVTFGSYPYVIGSGQVHSSGRPVRTVITLESADRAEVVQASETLLAALPQEHVIEFLADEDCLDVQSRLQ